MEKHIKYTFLVLITSSLFFANNSCGPYRCVDQAIESNLVVSFTIVDTLSENIPWHYNEDTIRIYELDETDRQASFRMNKRSRIDFDLPYEPYLGNHKMRFGIYWEAGDLDTLNVDYIVSEPEGIDCPYEFELVSLKLNDAVSEGIDKYDGYLLIKNRN